MIRTTVKVETNCGLAHAASENMADTAVRMLQHQGAKGQPNHITAQLVVNSVSNQAANSAHIHSIVGWGLL